MVVYYSDNRIQIQSQKLFYTISTGFLGQHPALWFLKVRGPSTPGMHKMIRLGKEKKTQLLNLQFCSFYNVINVLV